MRPTSGGALAIAVGFLALVACGGKIAPDDRAGLGPAASGAGAGAGTSAPPPSFPPPAAPPSSEPDPSSQPPPVAACPPTPPLEGTDCGWQYGLPCDYAIVPAGEVCGVQCRCSSSRSEPNHWTCFDIGCER
ncbi:MAG TPA: hypothetical protein VLT33_41495 [Labilithrix sp.]|nr:hypothetical protein [Labilithrix sp.]